MKLTNRIFSAFLCAYFAATAAFAQTIDCTDDNWRRLNPTECQGFTSNFISNNSFGITAAFSGAVIAGAGLLLASIAFDDDSGSSGRTQPAPQPTMQKYDTVGYTDPVALAAAMGTDEYNRNFEHYNEIRLGYSIARGYTGAGSNIAVLDTGDYGRHGTAVVRTISDAVATGADVEHYKIVDAGGDFMSYAQIGEIIASADNANIFNASWGIPTAGNISAYEIRRAEQIVRLTDAGFVQSIKNAATKNDAIFVWAAGNEGTKQSTALAAMGGVIPELNGHFINVVAWDTATGALADYSNHCGVTKLYCITAPGTDINVGVGTASGTSFAAPIVSGAVAVIREAFPYMTATEVTQLLFTTARDLGDAGVDEVYGWGMLDMERATRPVGATLVPLDNGMQPLPTTRAGGVIGRRVRSADLSFAFFDSFGRAFSAKLNDNITFVENGRAFERLRADEPVVAINMGNFEFGFSNENLLQADGLLGTSGDTLTSFIGIANDFTLGDVQFFQNVRFGFSAPDADRESFVSGFSKMYSASAKFGARWNDWTFGVTLPETVISGDMDMYLPVGKSDAGRIMFADYNIDLAERPSLEFSIGYKFITASYIDNPYGRDEFFVIAKHKLAF